MYKQTLFSCLQGKNLSKQTPNCSNFTKFSVKVLWCLRIKMNVYINRHYFQWFTEEKSIKTNPKLGDYSLFWIIYHYRRRLSKDLWTLFFSILRQIMICDTYLHLQKQCHLVRICLDPSIQGSLRGDIVHIVTLSIGLSKNQPILGHLLSVLI